jgi:hypothetical protein
MACVLLHGRRRFCDWFELGARICQPAGMEIASALVANHAEIEGDKLYVSGGAWAWTTVPALPQAMVVQLALILVSEPEEAVETVLIRVFVLDPTGAATYGTELVAKWPAPESLKPGQPIVVPVVLNVPMKATRAGRHGLAIFLDYDGTSRRTVPFAIVVAE